MDGWAGTHWTSGRHHLEEEAALQLLHGRRAIPFRGEPSAAGSMKIVKSGRGSLERRRETEQEGLGEH